MCILDYFLPKKLTDAQELAILEEALDKDPNERSLRIFQLKCKICDKKTTFAQGVLRLSIPLDSDLKDLRQQILAISSGRPWVDNFYGCEDINIEVERHTPTEEEKMLAQLPPSYNPNYVKVTFSHGCYRGFKVEELPAYKDYVRYIANQLSHMYPIAAVFLETKENLTQR